MYLCINMNPIDCLIHISEINDILVGLCVCAFPAAVMGFGVRLPKNEKLFCDVVYLFAI